MAGAAGGATSGGVDRVEIDILMFSFGYDEDAGWNVGVEFGLGTPFGVSTGESARTANEGIAAEAEVGAGYCTGYNTDTGWNYGPCFNADANAGFEFQF